MLDNVRINDDKGIITTNNKQPNSSYKRGEASVESEEKDNSKLLKILNHHHSPLVNYLFGLALYFGIGVKEDKESGISYLEEVVAHGNFELLMDMFFYLLKTDDNRIKVLIVDGLNKARDEMVEMGMALVNKGAEQAPCMLPMKKYLKKPFEANGILKYKTQKLYERDIRNINDGTLINSKYGVAFQDKTRRGINE